MFDKQIEHIRKKLPELTARVRVALVIGILGLVMTAHSLEASTFGKEELTPERTVAEEMLYLHELRENSGEDATQIDREIRENIVRFERGVETENGSAIFNKSGTATALESIEVNGRTVTFLLGAEHVSEKHSSSEFIDSEGGLLPTTEIALIANPQIGVIEAELLGCEQYVEEGSDIGSDLSICAIAYDTPTNFHDITNYIESAHDYMTGEEVATYGYPALLNPDENGSFDTVPFWSNSTIPEVGGDYSPDYTESLGTEYQTTWSGGEPAGYNGLDFVATDGMSGSPVVTELESGEQKIVAIHVSDSENPEHASVSNPMSGIQDIPSQFTTWYQRVKDEAISLLSGRAK